MAESAYVDAPDNAQRSQTGIASSAVALIGAVCSTFAVWRDRVRYRRALASMSERELTDIGVGWSSIAEEASKPFWRE